MGDTVKCRFSRCLHDSRDVSKDVAVKDGKQYFHPDCYELKKNAQEIQDYFCKYINTHTTKTDQTNVLKVCYELVIEQGMEPEYIKYCLWYFKTYKPGSLRYPFGIRKVCQSDDMRQLWEQYKHMRLVHEMAEAQEEYNKTHDDFEFSLPEIPPYKATGNKSRFSSVIGGSS